MTTTTVDTPSTIITVEGVPIGPSEVTIFLTMLASIATLIWHKDWGLGTYAPQLAAVTMLILPIVLGLIRSFKHHTNAKVAIAQINAPPSVVVVAPPAPDVPTPVQGTVGTGG